jgi:DNA polymerase III subunit beta
VKIRIDRDALADAIAWTTRAIGSRAGSNLLTIRIEANGGTVTFSASDNETSARAEFDTAVDSPGFCDVPGRLLGDITKTLPASAVELTIEENHLSVVCGRSQFQIPLVLGAAVPKATELPPLAGKVSAADFASAVSQITMAASASEALPQLTGIRLEVSGSNITLAATDRYRLGIRELEWLPVSPNANFAVLPPAAKLSEIAKGLADCEQIEIEYNIEKPGNVIGFSGKSRSGAYRSIATNLLDFEFPAKYRELIPREHPVVAYVEAKSLSEAIKRVRLVTDQGAAISFELVNEEMVLTARNSGTLAEAREVVSATLVGEIEKMQFNPGYFVDGLNATDSNLVRLGFTLSNKPVVITAAAEVGADMDNDFQYLLMPMRAGN